MAKIGSILQETRLRKGLTLERIADDTNISVRFLAKIEGDDFTGFPGEPYVVGFIHNYAEYLGFDPDDVVARYRNVEDVVAKAAAGAPDAATIAAAADEGAAEANPAPSPGEESAEPVQKPKRPRRARTGGADGQANAPAEAANAAGTASTAKPEVDAISAPGSFPRPVQELEAKPRRAARDDGQASRQKSVEPARASAPAELSAPMEASAMPSGQPGKGPALRLFIVGTLAAIILAAAIFWIVAGGSISGKGAPPKGRSPAEYRVEGEPFEKRLYVGDSLLVPLGDDVYKIRLSAIAEAVSLETPFGPLSLNLGQAGPIDSDKDGTPNASIVLGDFEKNRPASGALLRVEFAPPAEATSAGAEVTVSENSAQSGGTASQSKPDAVILKSSRGPYPFAVQVSFRGNCLFRYEVDRKEWVEKYFSKGETATINVSNGLTVWASNAQAAKMTFQAAGGKTADLDLGAPGEIAVKRIAWGHAEGTWALISSDLD